MPTSPPPGAAKKKKTGLVLALTSILAVALGLTLAWLTASDTKHNVFEFGEVNIELIEPGWDSNFDEGTPDDEKILTNVVPGQVVTKDPRMKNTGSSAAWVYTSVYVPKINGIPVFSWDEKLGEGWVVDTVSRSEKYDIYTFIYDKPLEGNSETPPVFEKVIINGELTSADLDNEELSYLFHDYNNDGIPDVDLIVNGLGIQKEGIKATTAKEALDIYHGDAVAVVVEGLEPMELGNAVFGTSPMPETDFAQRLAPSRSLVFTHEGALNGATEGDRYAGGWIENIYYNIEDLPYYSGETLNDAADEQYYAMLQEMAPWIEHFTGLNSIITLHEISPKNTSYWFADAAAGNNCYQSMNLSLLDTIAVEHMDNMFGMIEPQEQSMNVPEGTHFHLHFYATFSGKTMFTENSMINYMIEQNGCIQSDDYAWGVYSDEADIPFSEAYNANPQEMSKAVYQIGYYLLPPQ